MLIDEPVAWEPRPDVTDHNGQAITPEMDFFAIPPREIGVVRSARSTLTKGREPRSFVVLFLVLFGLGLVMLTAVHFTWNEEGLTAALSTVFLIAIVPVTWLFTHFTHTCTYVGSEGLATFRCRSRRDRIVRWEVFVFEDATELRTSQTRHYQNGVYTGTFYTFTWTDADGDAVYRLRGRYSGANKLPNPRDPFHFALAAETAWSVYLFDHLQHQLMTEGVIGFRLGGDDWVGVGPGFLDLQMNGELQRCVEQEIANITIKNGVFLVTRKDAKHGWFRSSGVFRFPYGNMANAKLFLFAVGRLVGVPIA